MFSLWLKQTSQIIFICLQLKKMHRQFVNLPHTSLDLFYFLHFLIVFFCRRSIFISTPNLAYTFTCASFACCIMLLLLENMQMRFCISIGRKKKWFYLMKILYICNYCESNSNEFVCVWLFFHLPTWKCALKVTISENTMK